MRLAQSVSTHRRPRIGARAGPVSRPISHVARRASRAGEAADGAEISQLETKTLSASACPASHTSTCFPIRFRRIRVAAASIRPEQLCPAVKHKRRRNSCGAPIPNRLQHTPKILTRSCLITEYWSPKVQSLNHRSQNGRFPGLLLSRGGLQIPRWLGSDPLLAWWLACTSHPGVLGSIPKRNERNRKQAHPVLKYRVPHGSQCVMGRLIHSPRLNTVLGSSSLIVHVLQHTLLPPHANSFVIGPAVIKHTLLRADSL